MMNLPFSLEGRFFYLGQREEHYKTNKRAAPSESSSLGAALLSQSIQTSGGKKW